MRAEKGVREGVSWAKGGCLPACLPARTPGRLHSVMISMYFSRVVSDFSLSSLLSIPIHLTNTRVSITAITPVMAFTPLPDRPTVLALQETRARRRSPFAAPRRRRARPPKIEPPSLGPAASLSVQARQYRKLLSPRIGSENRATEPKLDAIFARGLK